MIELLLATLLCSPSFAVREAAATSLVALGPLSLAALAAAEAGDDPQARHVAWQLAAVIAARFPEPIPPPAEEEHEP